MRDKIKLVSSAGTGHYYTTDKNKKNTPDKLEFKKFDPVVRKHVIYKGLSRQACSGADRECRVGPSVSPALPSVPVISVE